MVINTNIQAQQTANNLNASSNALAKSLSRLSSGSKIVTPSDDAAGLAVSSRLTSQMKRLDAAINNVVSAVSFTQTQDGFLKTIDKAFRRMGELVGLEVVDLYRTRIGPLELGDLPEGRWRHLTDQERAMLIAASTTPPAP